MAKKYIFSEVEKNQIEQAVKDLEKESCGEIVPYFVSTSDSYTEASWYVSLLLAALTSLGVGLLSYTWLLPFSVTPFEVSVIIVGVMILGFVLPMFIDPIKRLAISREKKSLRVQQRAAQAFLGEGVFNTEERVGVLIFVSQLERKVLVLGDEGINAKVKPEDWERVVSLIVSGIKRKEITAGLVEAISACKELLLQNGFVRKSTDFNELSDGLRTD
jgi:putative membrane protein